ncbi:hypothetical protein GCM10023257_28500 [Streptomyces hyderabadensis]|uniref:Uncharacterized protein n=1 Tax=Streptomyces hyderabadensis TaxID=598549 RepID=A0ABP9I3W4_9ACTN
MGHESRPCSIAIGLGSHDLGVADTTADLYNQGMSPLIVFTGATSRTTRERMPRGEADHYRERAMELGSPSTPSSSSRMRGTRARTSDSRARSSKSGACPSRPPS